MRGGFGVWFCGGEGGGFGGSRGGPLLWFRLCGWVFFFLGVWWGGLFLISFFVVRTGVFFLRLGFFFFGFFFFFLVVSGGFWDFIFFLGWVAPIPLSTTHE